MMPRRQRRVGAAGEHRVGAAGADRLERPGRSRARSTRMRRRPRTTTPFAPDAASPPRSRRRCTSTSAIDGRGQPRLPVVVDAPVTRVQRLAAAEACADDRAEARRIEPLSANRACSTASSAAISANRVKRSKPRCSPSCAAGRHLAADAAVERLRNRSTVMRPNAAARVADRVERRRFAAAETGDDADAGDGDTAGHAVAVPVSSSTTVTMSPNVFIARARSSGMEMWKRSSMAKRMVSESSESMPASASGVSGDSLSSRELLLLAHDLDQCSLDLGACHAAGYDTNVRCALRGCSTQRGLRSARCSFSRCEAARIRRAVTAASSRNDAASRSPSCCRRARAHRTATTPYTSARRGPNRWIVLCDRVPHTALREAVVVELARATTARSLRHPVTVGVRSASLDFTP